MPFPVRLYQTAHFGNAWESVFAPWFEKQSNSLGQSLEPSVVLVPNQAWGALLKQQALAAGFSTFGVHFWEPGILRKRLLDKMAPDRKVAIREDLCLLMAEAARQVARTPSARALAAEPDTLVGACDRLFAAGYDHTVLKNDLWRNIVARFEELLGQSGYWNAYQADRHLVEWSRKNPGGTFNALLAAGFSAGHWPLKNILKAACGVSAEADLCLASGRDTAPEQAWVGTWEEHYGEAALTDPVELERPAFSGLSDRFALDNAGPREGSGLACRIAGNVLSEADAIVAQAMTWLAEEDCSRLGIVLPPNSVLAREVSARLVKSDIPHHDAIGFFPAQAHRQSLLNAWVDFQRDQALRPFVLFLQLQRQLGLEDAGRAKAVEALLKSAFDAVLTDDLAVIRTRILENNQEESVADYLNAWSPLPAEADFLELYESCLQSLTALGWAKEVGELREKAEALAMAFAGPVKRETFLRWLADVMRTPGRTRNSAGRHPFSPLQVLSYDQADGQTFSHLVLGGLNHGAWPPEYVPSPILSVEDMEELNRASLQQGSQGEGHWIVSGGRGYLMDSRTERLLANSSLVNLLESTTHAIAATASVADDDDFSRTCLVSDFLLKLYRADCGTLLDESRLRAMAKATQAWLSKSHTSNTEAEETVIPMLRAHRARRDDSRPFGEYEFAFREPPPGGLRLSCKSWEDIFRRPASVWLTVILRVRKAVRYDEPPSWPLVTGSWVHSWLRLNPPDGSEGFFTRETQGLSWSEQVLTSSRQWREQIARIYLEAGRSLPDWWQAGWAEARACALSLAENLDGFDDWSGLASEWTLPTGAKAVVPGALDLPLTGRIDLVLAREWQPSSKTEEAWPEEAPFWVLDFKTGGDKPLSPNTLARGEGVQLALYALALDYFGSRQVSVSLARPGTTLTPQLNLEDLKSFTGLWAGLQGIHKSGVIGMAGPIRDRFRYVGDYPLATLPVNEEVLAAKWVKTHPQIPVPRPS